MSNDNILNISQPKIGYQIHRHFILLLAMAAASEGDDLIFEDDSDWDIDAIDNHMLQREFEFDLDDIGNNDSDLQTRVREFRADDGVDDIDEDDSDSDTEQELAAQHFADPAEHLQFVFEEIDTTALPTFDWQKTENVFCSPDFTPTEPYGLTNTATRALEAGSRKPLSYFQLFYDDQLIQKVGTS